MVWLSSAVRSSGVPFPRVLTILPITREKMGIAAPVEHMLLIMSCCCDTVSQQCLNTLLRLCDIHVHVCFYRLSKMPLRLYEFCNTADHADAATGMLSCWVRQLLQSTHSAEAGPTIGNRTQSPQSLQSQFIAAEVPTSCKRAQETKPVLLVKTMYTLTIRQASHPSADLQAKTLLTLV